jgi:hypothetical protein
VTRRISIFGRPKLISRQSGSPVARRVVSALRDMHVAQRADHLELDDDLILDYHVGGIFADNHVVVKDHDSPLLYDADPALSHSVGKSISETFSTNPWPGALATLKAHPMIRSVTGCNNRASPPSICIPLIRLEKPALASVPTPDQARMSYTASVNEP